MTESTLQPESDAWDDECDTCRTNRCSRLTKYTDEYGGIGLTCCLCPNSASTERTLCPFCRQELARRRKKYY